jgi:Chemoreceptor zinc-binding domain
MTSFKATHKSEPRKPVQVRVPISLLSWLQQLASERTTSVEDLVVVAVRHYRLGYLHFDTPSHAVNPADHKSAIRQIEEGINAHEIWKARLYQAIATGQSAMTVSVAERDDQCAFGEWILGKLPPLLMSSPHHAKVKELHATFHRGAALVLSLALAGKKAEADALMATGEYAKATNELIREMIAWIYTV